jgi:hypothetical protein
MLRTIINMAPQKQKILPHPQYLLSCSKNQASSCRLFFLAFRAAILAALPCLEACRSSVPLMEACSPMVMASESKAEVSVSDGTERYCPVECPSQGPPASEDSTSNASPGRSTCRLVDLSWSGVFSIGMANVVT